MGSGVVIFIEGDTEEEIYKQFLGLLHNMTDNGRFSVDKLIVRNLKGIGNYKNRIIRVFKNEILANNSDMIFDVFLCYDTDVFDFSAKPPINWIEVVESLKKAGADRIFHIRAKKSIEDWILNDISGLCNYLKINPDSIKFTGQNGIKKLENLFRKANKVYIKGVRAKGFISSLNIQTVMCTACVQLKTLCKKLGIKCNSIDKC